MPLHYIKRKAELRDYFEAVAIDVHRMFHITQQHLNPGIRPELDLRWPDTYKEKTQEPAYKPDRSKEPT